MIARLIARKALQRRKACFAIQNTFHSNQTRDSAAENSLAKNIDECSSKLADHRSDDEFVSPREKKTIREHINSRHMSGLKLTPLLSALFLAKHENKSNSRSHEEGRNSSQ